MHNLYMVEVYLLVLFFYLMLKFTVPSPRDEL